MKRLLNICLVTGIFIFSAHAQQWVPFSSSQPGAPKMNLQPSNAKEVTFTITLLGIYTLDTVENSSAFTRIILPGGEAINPVGHPELPVLTYRVAIPYCDDTEVAYQILSTQTMSSCWVYPVPEMVLNGKGNLVEQFAFEPTAYTIPRSNDPVATITSSGSLRSQKYVEITVYPIEFCPVTRQLSVIDQIEITLTFANPQGDLRQNVGIFNKVAASAFINYEDNGISALVNDKAFEKPGFTHGNVQWFTLSDTAQAATIPGDYLIITVPEFFDENNPHSQLKRLAEHRAFYNGFDVAIANVDNILSLPFYFEGNPDPEFMKEQKIRTFIRRVYEGQNAQNTLDGRLGYVLLVGDNYMGNTGMPTSFDHNVKPYDDEDEKYAADYYFTCITKDSTGGYDDVGDLFIGRLSVLDTVQLFNMVQKTIFHETEYSPKTWRKSAGFTNGSAMNTAIYHTYFYDFVTDILDEKEWNHSIVNYFDLNGEIKEPTLEYLNDGVVFAQYNGHGSKYSWSEAELTEVDFEILLSNNYRTPFINAVSCFTGYFDENEECLGEFLTRYDSVKGAVGYIGASRLLWVTGSSTPIDTNYLTYQECFPYYLFKEEISIVGELLLKSKVRSWGGKITKVNKYGFNLFGDPALNIFAEGYQITRDVTAECPAKITCKVRIHNGATLTVPTNCNLSFLEEGKLTIDENGSMVIEDGAQIIGINNEIEHAIHVKGGEFTVWQDVVFQDLQGGILLENNGSILYDKNKHYVLDGVTFKNTSLIHRGTWLNISNCHYIEKSDVITSISVSNIDSCSFQLSTFFSDNSDFPVNINISPYTNVGDCLFNGKNITNTAIQLKGSERFHIYKNEVSGYNSGISLTGSGMTLAHTNGFSSSGLIRENKISNCDVGIELYNSASAIVVNNIYNNGFGVKLYNNSYTSFENFPTAPQVIRDCSFIELYATPCSCPGNLRYNKIIDEDNLGNNGKDPLFCVDIDFCCVRVRDISLNYWGESFIHSEDIYPPGAFYTAPVWEPGKSGAPPHGDDEELYRAGLDYFANKNYTNAETTFKELIQTYPNSRFAIAALHELFALEHYTNQDFYGLNSYYVTISPSDSNLFNTADFLATRCYVKERDWQPAVAWYENRIENPSSYQDSVFAVIDLGEIHLMMEADTIGKGKSGHFCYYSLPNIKPKSRMQYEENKSSLLATLPQIKKSKKDVSSEILDMRNTTCDRKGSLGECVPNPTNGNATIFYEIFTGGVVEIQLFNSIGQMVKSLPQGKQSKGNYKTTISVVGMPVGVYHYTLVVNNERVDGKKVVVN